MSILRQSRFRLRTLIVAVAFVAFLLGIIVGLQRRRDRFLEIVAFHVKQDSWARELASELDARAMTAGGDCLLVSMPENEPKKAAFHKAAAYHAELAEKYRKAAAQPWWFVAADPPDPKPLPPIPAISPNSPPSVLPDGSLTAP